jgi:hypothetical protein
MFCIKGWVLVPLCRRLITVVLLLMDRSGMPAAATDGRQVKLACAVSAENCGVMSADCSRSGNVCSKCVLHSQ